MTKKYEVQLKDISLFTVYAYGYRFKDTEKFATFYDEDDKTVALVEVDSILYIKKIKG